MTTKTILTQQHVIDICGRYLMYEDINLSRAIERAVLKSPEVQAWKRDAERYRVLRDADYQMHEDDPCVTDDSFNTFFDEDLDSAVDALKDRYDAAMEQQK